MVISAILAMSQNYVIGEQGRLPWSIPEDLKRFRSITWGHPVIMGRRTWDSLGKPLVGRRNIVISRQLNLKLDNTDVVASVQEALVLTQDCNEVFIIGGAEIFRQVYSKIQKVYLTWIYQDYLGDCFFHEFQWKDFQVVHQEERQYPVKLTFFTLVRKI